MNGYLSLVINIGELPYVFLAYDIEGGCPGAGENPSAEIRVLGEVEN